MIPLLLAFVLGLNAAADEPPKADVPPPPAPPADFKVVLGLWGESGDAPGLTGELVVRRGVAYQFLSSSTDEVQVVDPHRRFVTLLDLKRRVKSSFTYAQLDDQLFRVRARVTANADRRAASGSRGDRLLARSARDLLVPLTPSALDASAKTLRASNATVEVVVSGEPEPDGGRLDVEASALSALTKLGLARDPEGLPPFARLAALEALTARDRLRPTELAMTFRLPAETLKMRWTFRTVDALTDREREAILRVENLIAASKRVALNEFDAGKAEEP